MADRLSARLHQALVDFKKEKLWRQNARLSLANSVYDNPTMPQVTSLEQTFLYFCYPLTFARKKTEFFHGCCVRRDAEHYKLLTVRTYVTMTVGCEISEYEESVIVSQP